jgi:hypothetical protein
MSFVPTLPLWATGRPPRTAREWGADAVVYTRTQLAGRLVADVPIRVPRRDDVRPPRPHPRAGAGVPAALADDAIRTVAREVRDEMATMPAPAAVMADLDAALALRTAH